MSTRGASRDRGSDLRRQLWPDWKEGHAPGTSLGSLWERVRHEFPENYTGIDRFPAVVTDNERYAQIEMDIADQHLPEPSPRRLTFESRFLEVLDLLWVLGPTYAETPRPHKRLLQEVPPLLRPTVEDILARPRKGPLPLVRVDDVAEFRSLALLGLRGYLPSVFVFAPRNLVLWQNDISFTPVYLGDIAYKHSLQTLCTTCGLFLRGA